MLTMTKLEIFGSVIGLVTVDMMNSLVRPQRTAEFASKD